MELTDILTRLSVLNRDNGKYFFRTDRLDAIAELLWNSSYRRVNADGLFALYAKKPLSQLMQAPVTVISTHVDCERGITACFSASVDETYMRGTYDNAVTNAAAVAAMLSEQLPDNVLIAFTGDEEEDCGGAKQLLAFLRRQNARIRAIAVLDVTDMAWNAKADLTVENDFFDDDLGETIIRTVQASGYTWRYVPADPDDVPDYVPKGCLIHEEADEDESWYYDEERQQCFSFCLPIFGPMHSDEGVLARKASFPHYYDMLIRLMQAIS
ncbi:MAG: M20/M25/M40 family metallo-hydrolase [Oscillospiraceae bacterium]|nr:M20/M25/M40 family metallo-hydrolase [Oscillospiraceae bacterium]